MSALSILAIEVGAAQLDATVRVPRTLMRTSACAELPARALELLPGLARHSCENDSGACFAEELRDTETAHLFEHIACELMALAGSPRTLKGETSWDFGRDGEGVFHVRLAFDDDLVALGALKEAAVLLDALYGYGKAPDVASLTERLARLRSRAG